MAYRVKIESFEGPFDLLLYLVGKNKVDVGSISITEIVDQYLAEIEKMKKLDLDVASDFLLAAATLLKIKAESLLPQELDIADGDIEELEPSQAREILIEKLITYKTFKNATRALESRGHAMDRMHTRDVGMRDEFGSVAPNYLENITLPYLSELAAKALARREIELLESEHIARTPIPVSVYMDKIMRAFDAFEKNANDTLGSNEKIRVPHTTFYDLLEGDRQPAHVVVTFLAMLELHKRGRVSITQDEIFGNIKIECIEQNLDLGIQQSQDEGTNQDIEQEHNVESVTS